MRAHDRFPKNILVLALILLLLGSADAAEFVGGILESGRWSFGTQLLLLPAGISLLRRTEGGLRFARAVVVVSMAGTAAVAVIGAMTSAAGVVSLGAAAPSGSPWWGFALAGSVLLALEGVAFVWIRRALRERT
jgi:hypothetical protein